MRNAVRAAGNSDDASAGTTRSNSDLATGTDTDVAARCTLGHRRAR